MTQPIWEACVIGAVTGAVCGSLPGSRRIRFIAAPIAAVVLILLWNAIR